MSFSSAESWRSLTAPSTYNSTGKATTRAQLKRSNSSTADRLKTLINQRGTRPQSWLWLQIEPTKRLRRLSTRIKALSVLKRVWTSYRSPRAARWNRNRCRHGATISSRNWAITIPTAPKRTQWEASKLFRKRMTPSSWLHPNTCTEIAAKAVEMRNSISWTRALRKTGYLSNLNPRLSARGSRTARSCTGSLMNKLTC